VKPIDLLLALLTVGIAISILVSLVAAIAVAP
jgi:hypothetical protein